MDIEDKPGQSPVELMIPLVEAYNKACYDLHGLMLLTEMQQKMIEPVLEELIREKFPTPYHSSYKPDFHVYRNGSRNSVEIY